jgi:hypothetical protein
LELDTSIKGQVIVQFEIGSISSIGTANIYTLISEVQFHIINANIPFLLCLVDIDKLQVYYNNIWDVLVTHTREVPIVKYFKYAFLLYNSSL